MQIQQAFLDAQDGLVRSIDWLYFHGNQFRWNLIDPRSNPTNGENFNRFTQRLSGRIPNPTAKTQRLSGHFHLGIHPHFHSYYHFWTELIPQLLTKRESHWLLPWWLPVNYITFLQQLRIRFTILPPRIFQCESLTIPEKPSLQDITHSVEHLRQNYLSSSTTCTGFTSRIYISRRRVKRRHLQNEQALLPILDRYGYGIVELEDWSLEKQIQLFGGVTHVVAPHGAGLANTLWMPVGTRVLEIRPSYASGDFCFSEICELSCLEHEVLVPTRQPTFQLEPVLLTELLQRWHPTV
jgi:capsular polysaccharide biosynthesis protein